MTSRTSKRLRRGFSYLELVASVMLVALAGTCAVMSWGLAPKALAAKRLTEMSIQLGGAELERLKSLKYEQLVDTAVNAPNVQYFDKFGALLGSSTGSTYKLKSWVITQDTNHDGTLDSVDLRELTVEVWNPAETSRYEQTQTLLAFGGI